MRRTWVVVLGVLAAAACGGGDDGGGNAFGGDDTFGGDDAFGGNGGSGDASGGDDAFDGDDSSGAASGGSGAGRRMVRSEFCDMEACESRRSSCLSACDRCLDSCFEASSFGAPVNCSSACAISCNGDCPTCSEGECRDKGYRFELPEIDPESLEACEASIEKAQMCDGVETTSRCDVWARLATSDRAKAEYRCSAESACDARVDCIDFAARVAIGEEVCARSCWAAACDDNEVQIWNAVGFLDAHVHDTVRECLELSDCDDVEACTDAFRALVFGF